MPYKRHPNVDHHFRHKSTSGPKKVRNTSYGRRSAYRHFFLFFLCVLFASEGDFSKRAFLSYGTTLILGLDRLRAMDAFSGRHALQNKK